MKINQMNIVEFTDSLISATRNGTCKWIDNNDAYRLILQSGSVILRIMYDPVSDYTRYEIKLFDNLECFASYVADSFDQLYDLLETLFKVIKEMEQIEIEKKFYSLYSDVKRL